MKTNPPNPPGGIPVPEQYVEVFVSYRDVVEPLIKNPDSAESCTLMEVLEQRLVSDKPEAYYFEVDYPLDQTRLTRICEVWDEVYNDIVKLILWYND